jgi:hypothetical protein
MKLCGCSQELSNLANLVSQDEELLSVLGSQDLVLTVFAPNNDAIRYGKEDILRYVLCQLQLSCLLALL